MFSKRLCEAMHGRETDSLQFVQLREENGATSQAAFCEYIYNAIYLLLILVSQRESRRHNCLAFTRAENFSSSGSDRYLHEKQSLQLKRTTSSEFDDFLRMF